MRSTIKCMRIVLGLICCLASSVSAHEGRPVYIQVKTLTGESSNIADNQQRYSLQWKIPPVFVPGAEPSISLNENRCRPEPFQNAQGLIGKKHYVCSISSTHPKVKIEYPDVNPALSSLLVFQDKNGNNQHVFSDPETLIIEIPDSISAYTLAKQYIVGGINHILLGWDHLLFVLCLLILAGSLRRILITITGFTLAHTITLVLTALNLISLPFLLVEVLIALSIVVLAAETLKGKLNPEQKSLSWRYPVIVASLFGLLHGFGFASILDSLGLPQNMKMTALLFFNLGIELGQLAFIAIVLLFVSIVKKVILIRRQQDNILHVIIYLTGLTASYWMVQRLIST